jgi:hypothetical protein
MLLDDCPLCEAIKEGPHAAYGDHCVRIQYKTVELIDGMEVTRSRPAVVLIEHEATPSPEAVAEALTMFGDRSGMVEDIRDVAGHWGMYVKDGNWAAGGKSSTYDSER